RIEGHLGQAVGDTVTKLQTKIKGFNLPFTVRAVLLGGTRSKIVVKPPIRYGDLHRFHQLIRQDLSLHLDDVIAHSQRLKADGDLAVQDNVFDDRAAGQEISIKGLADETRVKVETAATSAKNRLAQRYSQYKTEPWQDEVKETVTQAATMRLRLGDV